MPSASASSAACSGPAPPNGTSVKSRGSRPRLTVTTRIERAMLLLRDRDDAARRILDRETRCAPRSARPPFAQRPRRGATPPARSAVAAEPPEHDVRVGDGRAPCRRGRRRRARARAPALWGPTCGRSPASTQAIEPPPAPIVMRSMAGKRIGWPNWGEYSVTSARLAVADDRDVGGRAPDVEADDLVEAFLARELLGHDDRGGRAARGRHGAARESLRRPSRRPPGRR